MPKSERSQRVKDLVKDLDLKYIPSKDVENIRIENCIGFTPVPVGLAGPLRVTGLDTDEHDLYAPLATREATLVASCSRGCKAFGPGGGIRFEVMGEGMTRAPAFVFADPSAAFRFAREFPALEGEFGNWAKSTSRFVRLQEAKTHVIGSKTHILCSFHCGSASGQNMCSKAAQFACSELFKLYGEKFGMKKWYIDGNMSSDKKPSWLNVFTPRGVAVTAWGIITDEACQETLGCTTEDFYHFNIMIQDCGIRYGQFGSNVNTANILAALFISTGQDAASVGEAAWSHLTFEYDKETRNLTVSLYFPSMPLAALGGGTGQPAQLEALRILRCEGTDKKWKLAGLIASFALALDMSTSSAVATGTFTASHMKLARGQVGSKL